MILNFFCLQLFENFRLRSDQKKNAITKKKTLGSATVLTNLDGCRGQEKFLIALLHLHQGVYIFILL